MARKPTIAEQRQAMIDAYFANPGEDPLVREIRARRAKEEEEQRRRGQEPEKADFTGVSARVTPDEPEALSLRRLLPGNVIDTIFGEGVSDTLGTSLSSSLASAEAATTTAARDADNPFLANVFRTPSAIRELSEGRIGGAFTDEGLRTAGNVAAGKAEARAKEVARRLDEYEPGVGKEVLEGFSDLVQSPESLGSLVGGPGGALSLGGAYLRTYDQARRAGMSEEKAKEYAALKSAPEAIGFVPAGKLIEKIPGLGKVVSKAGEEAVSNIGLQFLKKVGLTSAGEAVGEGATEIGQMGIDAILATEAPDQETRDFAQSQLPKDTAEFWDRTWRATKAGGLGGGVFQTPGAFLESAAEAGRRAGDITDLVDKAKLRGKAQPDAEPDTVKTVVDSIDQAQLDREYDAALKQRDEQNLRATSLEFQAERLAQGGGILADAFKRAGVENFADLPTAPAPRQGEDTGNLYTVPFDPQYTQEAQKAAAKEAKDTKSAATAARGKARNAYKQQLLATTKDMTPEQRQIEMAQRLKGWDTTNPLSSFEGAKPESKPKKTARQKAEKKDTTAEFQALLGKTAAERTDPLAQVTEEADTGVRAEDVGKALRSSVGSSTTGQVATLGRKGQLEIVDDVADITEVEGLQQAGKGFYDPKSGKVYVVANRLNKDNVKGDLLDVLSHEVKHGADIGGSEGLRGSFKTLVGDKANASINSQIRNLAKQDTVEGRNAKKVVDFVESKYKKGDWDLELPANYINAANATQGGPVRTIVSAIRTAVKSDNINLNDVKYLAGKLVKETARRAETGESFKKTDDSAKATIVSGGKTAYQALQEGRTYLSSDGKRKYEIDDSKSKLNVPADVSMTKRYKSGDVFTHEELYNEFPELADVPVMFENDPDSKYGASYRKRDPEEPKGLITINLSNQKGGDRNRFGSLTHRDFLHEMQHAAQDVGGTTGGASVDDFLGPVGRKAKQRKDDARAALNFAQAMGFPKSEMNDIMEQVDLAEADYNDEFERASEEYMKVLGEGEAYQTVGRLGLTKAERAEDTYDIGKNLEDQILQVQGKVTTERGKKLAEVKRDAPLASLGGLDLEDASDVVNTGLRIAKRLFTPTMGFGHELNEMRLNSRNFVSSESAKAENLGRNVQDAIANVAKTKGIPEDQLREEIEKTLDEIDALPDATVRAARMDALDRRFPGVGRALNDLRSYKWQLARELIALRLRDKAPMDEKELNIYKKVMENAETYSTRAYRSQLGGNVGKKYAKTFLKRAKRNPQSDEGKKLTAGIEWLINNQLMIPNRDSLEDMSMLELRRLHEQWVGPSANFKGSKGKAQMVERLDDMERMTREELEPVAMDVIKQLLGLTNTQGPIASYYRGAKQDRTVLEARKAVPKELRDVMGQVTDPYLREMISVARMTQLMGKTKLLTEVYENGKGRWWSDTPRPGFDEKLSGAAFGPMKGKYVTKDAYDFLSDSAQYNATFDQQLADTMRNPTALTKAAAGAAVPILSQIAGVGKMASIVLNPTAMAFNAVGAAAIVLPQNGMIPGSKETWAALHNAARVIKGTVKKHENPEALRAARELLFAGVMDSATVGEFRSKLYGDIFEQIGKLDANQSGYYMKAYKTAQQAISKGGKTGVGLVRDVYAFMDVWAKVATYYNRKSFLTEYNKANNGSMSDEDIIRQAGYQASLTNISYDHAIPAIRVFERNAPFIGQFATYFSEVPRSLTFSAVVGLQDINLARNATTTKARNLAAGQAFKRLTGTALVTAGLTAALSWAISNEPEDEKRKRQLDPEWERANAHIPLGMDKSGNEVMASINRIDPNGPLTDVVRQVILAPKGEKLDAMEEGFKGLFVKSQSVVRTLQLLNDVVLPAEFDEARKKNTALERNFPEAYAWASDEMSAGDFGENFMSLVDSIIPAPLLGAIDKQRVPVDGPAATAARLLGYKAYVRDPDKSLMFRTLDYKNEMKELKKDRNALLDRINGMDIEELSESLQDLTVAEQKVYDDLYRAYDGYLAFDKKTPASALGIVKEQKVGNEVTLALRRGSFVPTLVSSTEINKWAREQVKKNPKDREDILRKRELLLQAYAGTEE